jgi:DNA-binding response OmpR family regulator
MAVQSPPQVLVVEDQPDLADLYREWLAAEYEVRVVNEGASALSALDDATDVVLLDRRMPDLSGDEVLARVRDRGLDCRVAMVTAVTPDVDVIEMGFDDYLVKPVTCEELHAAVERLVRRSSHSADLQEFFSLARKKAVLDTERAAGQPPSNEAYAQLDARVRETSRALEERLGQLEPEDYEVLFYDLPADFLPDHWDRPDDT